MINKRVKLIEMIAPQTLSAGTTYNGVADASGIGVDMKDYDECMIVVSVGTVPTNGTLDVTVRESNDDTEVASASSAISGATFKQVDADSDQANYVCHLNLKNRSRYLYVKAVVANQSIPVAVNGYAVGNEFPVDNSETFEV